MKARGRELSELDRIGLNHFFFRLRPLIHFLLVITHVIILLLGICGNHWPRYCFRNNWAYFAVIGLYVSALINVLSTFITYVIFEDLNWVLISTLLLIYGTMFTICGILYISDDLIICVKCNLPVFRSWNDEETKFFAKSVALSIFKRGEDQIQMIIGYATLIIGILYVIFLSYYLLRREKA